MALAVAESFINKLIDEKDFDLSVTSRQESHQVETNNVKINSYQFNNIKFDNSIKKVEEAEYILVLSHLLMGKILLQIILMQIKKF